MTKTPPLIRSCEPSAIPPSVKTGPVSSTPTFSRPPLPSGIAPATKTPLPRTGAPGGKAAQLGRDHDRAVGLLVPKRERALQGADAEQCGTLSAIAYISCQDVQAVDHDVAAAYPATGENLHLARGGDGGKPDRAQLVDRAVVVDRPAVRVDLYPQPLHVVVPAKPHAVHITGEDQHRVGRTAGELLAGQALERPPEGDLATHHDPVSVCGRCQQLFLIRNGPHGAQSPQVQASVPVQASDV